MIRESFHKNWSVCREGGSFLPGQQKEEPGARQVDLPHDAMLYEYRDAACKNSNAAGFYPGGIYSYSRHFQVPRDQEGSYIWLELEGVYQNARVFVNGDYAGGWKYGYTTFRIRLDQMLYYGAENEIRVIAENDMQPNARWYTGSGICRGVSLI